LIRAIQQANPALVSCLLERGASPNLANSEGLNPVLISYQNDSEEIRELLRAKGGVFTKPTDLSYVVVWLASNGNSRMLQDLAKKDGLAFGRHHLEFMLQEAVKVGNGQLFAGLQALGCDLNAQLANGDTPLTLSVKMDSLETARALLRAGAKVEVANKEGLLPISLVQEQGAGEAMRKLLKAHYR
jgi:ankyrin repeat protein